LQSDITFSKEKNMSDPKPGSPEEMRKFINIVDKENFSQFAREVYKAVGGREYPVFKDADDFGVSADLVTRAIEYWVGEGIMRRMGVGTNEISLTHEGLTEIESWPEPEQ
jgi:hypothetical protein